MRRLVPAVLIATLALAACGGDDDTATSTPGSTLPSPATTAAGPTTTVDPELCYEVPAAATPSTTAPAATTAPPVGPTLPPATTTPPPTTTATRDTTPGTVTEGVDAAAFPAGERPQAIRPCTLPTALQVTTLRPGSGLKAQASDQIYIDYTGIRSADGQVFDESYTRGEAFDFKLGEGGVIQGWDLGLVGAQTGALIRLDIPAELAYGDQPQGEVIQPGDALTFLAEVRAVIPATTHDDAPLDVTVDASEGATEVTTKDVVVGSGPAVESGQTAIVHVLLVRGDNRVVLLNTWEQNAPASIPLIEGSASLPGLVEGLAGATVGTTRIITLPPADAFGEQGDASLGLPPATDLIVVAEVLGVLGEPGAG